MFQDSKKIWTFIGYTILTIAFIAHLMDYLDYYSFMKFFVVLLVFGALRLFMNNKEEKDKYKVEQALFTMFVISLILLIPSYTKYRDLERLHNTCEYLVSLDTTHISKDPEYFKIRTLCEDVLSEPDDSGDDF